MSHAAIVTQILKNSVNLRSFAIFTLGKNNVKQLGHKNTKASFISQARPLHTSFQTGNDYSTEFRIACAGPECTIAAYGTHEQHEEEYIFN